MPRVDDYIQAKAIAAEKLAATDAETVARRAGFETTEAAHMTIRFLDRSYRIGWPTWDFEDAEVRQREVPVQEQVLILHYLLGAIDAPPSGNWIAYREIPGASFYFSAFVKRAIDPLKAVFGQNIQGFKKAAALLEGADCGDGDAGYEFRVLPKVPLRLILWAGDDEFGPEATILFDDTAGRILSAEDAAWLAGMLVYRLMALARG